MVAPFSIERIFPMSFARKLHDLRIAKRLSLQDVADAVGISKAHVWNLEKAITANPSMDLVVKLAELFRVRVADLVGDGPDANEEAPEMVAMFRDFKQLEPRDRETIAMLMEQMKRRKGKPD
jgi:transcriptional regulator with XRE-family HTH domain